MTLFEAFGTNSLVYAENLTETSKICTNVTGVEALIFEFQTNPNFYCS